MPIDISVLNREGNQLFREWKEKVRKHNKYLVKNKYYKERKMDLWNQELNEINDYYRKTLKSLESEKKKELFELKKIAKEAEQKKKEAEQNAKEERSRKRRINKEKTRSELAKKVPRRSSRIAAKKKTRCPNGTRRNKKSGNCEKKTAHTRKRCPNGTRKNKKSGKCVNTSK